MPILTDRENSSYSPLMLMIFGFIIGIASITPGLSGGVLAISFGIYAASIKAVTKLRSDFKNSFLFLLPLAIGAGIGIIVFGIIMKPLLENFKISVIYLFMGMILGSIPSFLKQSNKDGFRLMYILPLLITFSLGMIVSTSFSSFEEASFLTIPILLISGGVLSIGIIIPGISSSFILLQMGVYEKLISSFLEINIYSIFWVIVGFLLVTILTVKIVNIAFSKFHGYSHYAALGFLASSFVSVFPGFENGFIQIINLILFVVGIMAVFLFMKKAE